MESYLIYCRQNLENLKKFKEVYVVLGNETCDLDSVVSSLVTAYFLHHIKSTKDRIIIPVLNTSRKDLFLYSEVTYFLEETNLSIDPIICRNEIDLKELHTKRLLYLVLVDHNVLPFFDAEMESAVIEIIDHHKQEHNMKKNCQIVIEPVGSCCTLVAERIFKTNEKLMDPQIALLLYGSIILDTFCFNKAAQIATSKDRDIAEKLEVFLDGVSKEEVFEVLHSAKYDQSSLTAEDILRKDLKNILHDNIKIGISAVPSLLNTFNKKFDLELSLSKFYRDNNYSVLIVMSLNIDKKTMHITREIAVYSELHDLHTQICKALESESSLQLTNLNFNIPNLKGYHQGNVSLTRKYVLPFIKDVIKNMSNICSVKNTDEENKKLVSSNSLSKEGNIKNGTSYLLDVTGDPVSSQSSSNQNSCPYTPQNSYVEDSYEQDSDPLTLPSFNNRDMIAKIEEKRSKLGGFDGDSDFSAAKSIPFTPKNSEINISMKCPAEQNSESRVIFEQLQGKKDILNQFLEESKLKKQENIEDSGYSESSNGKELINSLTVKSDLIKEKAEIDAGINSGNISPDDSDTFKDSGTEKEQSDNRQNKNKFRPLNNFDGNDPLIAAHYLAETVDFPDSPQHLKLLKRRSREAQGITDDDEDEDDTSAIAVISLSDKEHQLKCDRPTTLNTNCSTTRRRKITVNPDVLSSDMRDEDQKSLSSLSNKSDVDMFSPVDDLVTPDDIDTPDDLDDFTLGNGYSGSDPIPELSATEEIIEERNWKTCFVGGSERKIDMKVIEPYKKVLSHGGYFGPDRHAIIVFGACYLPDRSRHDYDYVMDNLFLYVLTTLDQLVAEDYILIYFHGATRRSNMPSFGWLKRCYQMIDRRLRKNLKGLYLVHPTFWLKTIVIMTRPFISSKFSRKLRFINSLQELSDLIPMDHVSIPDIVKKFDEEKNQDAYF